MKKILLSLSVLIFSINAYSQTGVAMGKEKFRLGIYFSYDNNLSSDRIIYDQYAGYTADYNPSNYSVGLSLDYRITSNLFLVSGINYSDRSFTGTFFCDVCNFSTSPQPEKIGLQFVEIPIMAKYFFLSSSFNIFGEAGFGNLIRINSQTGVEGEDYLISAKVGGGIEYPFLDNYSLLLSVDYSQNLTKLFQDADYAYRILGIKLGVAIDL